MIDGPVLEVGFSSISPLAGGEFVILTFSVDGGESIQLRIPKSDAVRLSDLLATALSEGQPVPRRRYHDIKPGRFQG